jgi:hypothetical protein
MVLSEEAILYSSALTALTFSLALAGVAYAATRSRFFQKFVFSGTTFHRISHWLSWAWAAGTAFQFAEFSTAALLNKTLLLGNVISARGLLPYTAAFAISAGAFLYARYLFRKYYASKISGAPVLGDFARGGFLGLSTSDVEVLKHVREFKGDLQKAMFETGWLEEGDVVGSLRKLAALGLIRVRDDRAYVTLEGSDVLTYPLSLFNTGVDRRTLEELASARDAMRRGDDLHVISACSRTLERVLKERVVAPNIEGDAAEIFGKPLERLTLGDLIGFVRDKRKDHFLLGLLTTINEARKSLHDVKGAGSDAASVTYLLTELAVKYINTSSAGR